MFLPCLFGHDLNLGNHFGWKPKLNTTPSDGHLVHCRLRCDQQWRPNIFLLDASFIRIEEDSMRVRPTAGR
jgi:hypothetical protein